MEARGGSEPAGVLIRRMWVGLVLTLVACGGEAPPSESSAAALSPVPADSASDLSLAGSQAVAAAVDAAMADLIPGTAQGAAAGATPGDPRAGGRTTEGSGGLGIPGVPTRRSKSAALIRTGDGSPGAARPDPMDPVVLAATVPDDHRARTGQGGVVAPLDLSGGPEVFPRPTTIRGVYVNAWAAGSARRSQNIIRFAARTEINAFVIDLKDATGFISYPTEIPLAQEIGADQEIRIRDLPGLLTRLRAAGVYPIARIVIAKDPLLTEHRPEWAVQDRDGGVWSDDKGVSWANIFDPHVWEYNVALAREAAAMGFPEVQWDYVRFPDGTDSVMSRAVYPGAEGRKRTEAIRAFLEYAEARLREFDIAITADVFGVTTAARNDLGIGQLWESFIDRVDAALPMVYPSHYSAGSYGIQSPNAFPYEIVRAALTDARGRSDAVLGAGSTRPWLQDFTLGAPRYGGPELRAQIQATYDSGIREWILWNPSVRYSESGLLPAGGLPAGVELTMLIGGKVVPVSQRFEYLDAALIHRIAERRLAPLVMPMPRYLTTPLEWAGRVGGG